MMCDYVKKNKVFLIHFLIPLTIFIILLLAYYPGIITYDGNNQWQQVQSGIFEGGHPYFTTFFLLVLAKIHNSTTTVLLYQIGVFSLIWGVFCQSIKTDKKGEIIKVIGTLLISLSPIIGLYAISMWKDILYTYYLFAISVMFYIGINKDFNYSYKEYILLGLFMFLVFSYRYNGIIVIILLILILLGLLYKKRQVIKVNLSKVFSSLGVFILLILLAMISKNIMIKETEKVKKPTVVKSVSISTIDSYMLWMMGAHLKDNNIKNKSDLEFIDKVLDVDLYKKEYNPYLINSINGNKKLDREYLSKHKVQFKNIFIKYSLKYPLTIVNHYLKADALLINPISQKYSYVYVYSFSEWKKPYGFEEIVRSKIVGVKNIYNSILNFTMEGVNIYFYQPALILYFSIILLVVLAKKVYDKRIYLFGLPMVLNTISLLPINLAQDLRYVYINYLTFFGIILLIIVNYKKVFKKRVKI